MARRIRTGTIQDENQISFLDGMGIDNVTPAVSLTKPKEKTTRDIHQKAEKKSKTDIRKNTHEPENKKEGGGTSSQRKSGSPRRNRDDRATGDLFDTERIGNSTTYRGGAGEITVGNSRTSRVSGTVATPRDVKTGSGRAGFRPTDLFAAADAGLIDSNTGPALQHDFAGAKAKEDQRKVKEPSLFDFDSAASTSAPLNPVLPFSDAAKPDAELLITTTEPEPKKNQAPNFQYKQNFQIGDGGAKTKAKNNIAAIRLIKSLRTESREASDDEQVILAKFVGWGGIPQIFDDKKKDWAPLYHELEGLLTAEEYEAARFSTINAHYTNRAVIEAMWEGLQGLGFDGGRVLEPGMGVGYFMGLTPDDIRDETKLTGVELDPITGQIARALYPQAEVRIEGFETTKLRFNSFDAAIGNVPFGDIVLRDPVHNKGRHSIHDHFISKSLDLAKPGAIAAFVTSRYTMDKMNPAARRELENKADLVGAIRLPSNTFASNAGTAVVTDILVFRKRIEGEEKKPQEWVKTGEIKFGEDGKNNARINQYFVDNPDMMLGQIGYGRGMYSDEELRWTMDESTPIRVQIDLAFQKIIDNAQSNNLMWSPQTSKVSEAQQKQEEILINPDIEEGSFYVDEKGNIRQYILGRGEFVREYIPFPKTRKPKAAERDCDVMRRMIEIRDCARNLLRLQMSEWDEESRPPWEAEQRKLNRLYDQFVSKHGALNSPSKRKLPSGASGEERFSITRKYLKLFKDDPAANFVRALEIYNDDTAQAIKTDIFHSRVISPDRTITGVENAHDGLIASLTAPDKKGQVDLSYISDLTGRSQEEVIEELGEQIYKNPVSGEWETADAYLSGNVRAKLAEAKEISQNNNKFMRNVAALEKMIPEDLSPQQIDVALGAPWVPEDIIEQFIQETLELETNAREDLIVSFYQEQSLWRIKSNNYQFTGTPKVNVEWGTSRKPMLEIIADTMNQKNIEIYDNIEDNKKVKNTKGTLAAREKQQKIIDRFRKWVWEDEVRAERLARIYNDRYNNIRQREYISPTYKLSGMNNLIKLRQHQLDVIWRIVQTGNTLMGHAVGAGKTLAAIGASMEEKRLGLTNKPLHVVPNHMLEQYAADFQKAYPDAKILVADKDDFTGDRRQHFVAQCATGNWDAVIMTHSSFGKVGVSAEREAEFLRQRIDEYTSMIEKAKEDGDRFTVKMFEKLKKTREEKIQNLLKSDSKDNGITFEEMGIDRLFVDEAHLFKNLEFSTRTKGVSQSSSQRAMDLFMKIGYLEDINPGRSAVFMTGTPIANSVAEAYTMMRYLYLDKMKEAGIDNFDSWISMFGEFVTALELAPDGGSYRMHSRLAKFRNVPELKQMFLEFADIMTADMLDLPKPKLKNGKHTIITVPSSNELKDYIQELVRRAEAVKNRAVEPHVDNMLKITSDGRKAALDLREVGIDVALQEQEGLKLKHVAMEIAKRYHANKDNVYTDENGQDDPFLGAIQSAFCDLSTPKDAFNAYDQLKDYLTDEEFLGGLVMPVEAIRFVHDYNGDKKKAQLFEDCRQGKVGLILGSTQKMGFGTNIQKRMIAQHHLDAPWRPADIEQRDGRIDRQGNQNEEIEILRYVTEGSFDVYMWQALERKAKFIAQLMSKHISSARTFEDNDVKSLSYAEVKAIATGDTRLIELAEIESKLVILSGLRDEQKSEQWRLKQEVKSHAARIEMLQNDIANIEKTIDQAKPGKTFSIDGVKSDDQQEAGKPLMVQIRKQYTESNIQAKGYLKSSLGHMHGYPIILETGGKIGSETLRVTLRAPFEIELTFYEDDLKKMKMGTLLNRFTKEFEKLQIIAEDSEHRIKEHEGSIIQKSKYIGAQFESEEDYQQLGIRYKELKEALRPTAEESEMEGQIDLEEAIEHTVTLENHLLDDDCKIYYDLQ